MLLHLPSSHYSRKDSPCATDDDAVRLRQVKGGRVHKRIRCRATNRLCSSTELSNGVQNPLAPLHFCSSDLALPLLMFGFAQMASAEVEHQGTESRTQAGAELEPRAFAQLQPVVQTFSSQTFSILCSWFCWF